MNAIYRLIWSNVSSAWVAVAEGTRCCGKGRRAALTLALLATAASAPVAGAPAGGVVTAGDGSITQSAGVTSVVQNSKTLSLNWHSFNIGSAETVNFVQPSASALVINRVSGGNPSEIFGKLNASGQVFLINPGGILFGAGAQINVGSLIASTLDLDGDGDSLSRRFSGTGQGSIVNQGVLRASGSGNAGGYIALLGNQVVNHGLVTARLGSVALAAGNAVTLSFADNSLINVQVDRSVFKTLADNHGLIVADGGQVIMTAGARDALLESMTSNSGVVSARGLENRQGKIVLTAGGASGTTTLTGSLDVTAVGAAGDSGSAGQGGSIAIGGKTIALCGATVDASGSAGGGTITIGGGFHGQAVDGATTADSLSVDGGSTIRAVAGESGNGGQVALWSAAGTRFEGVIDARATGAPVNVGGGAGNGGSAEVSSAGLLEYRGSTNLLSTRGATGNLLLDPYDITISTGSDLNSAGFTATGIGSTINTGTLQTALGTANVTVSTGSAGAQSGNITVANPLVWSAATTLTLNASGAIAINAPITASNAAGGLTLSAGSGQNISASGAINVGAFSLSQGNWLQNSATLPAFYAGNFSLAGTATFLRAAGGSGTPASPYQLTDIYGMQGMGSAAPYLAASYLLGRDIDASSTSGWNGAAGFLPIGSTTTPFTGTLDGRNYALANLSINRPTLTTGVGLFGVVSNAALSNLLLLNENVTGGSNGVGGLTGKAIGSSTISNVTTTGSVSGTNTSGVDNIGGIIGQMIDTAALSKSSSAANVTGYFYNSGGAVGVVGATTNTLNSVSASGTVTGSTWSGGLIGTNRGTINDSYASGAVTQASGTNVGGLAGRNDIGGKINRSYATGAVTGTSVAGNFIGLSSDTVTASYWNSSTGTKPAGIALGTTAGATGLSSTAFQIPSNFAGWDFSNLWNLTPGLNPTLRGGTTLLGSAGGNLTVSSGANSATVVNTGTLQSLLNAGSVLLATANGTLTVSNATTWSGAGRLNLAASGAVAVNASLTASGPSGGVGVYSTASKIGVTGATIATNGGNLSLFAPAAGSNDALTLSGVTLNTGSGSANLAGNSVSGNGIVLSGANSLVSTGTGAFSLAGTTRTGRGFLLSASSALTASGNATLSGLSTSSIGFAFCVSGCTSSITSLAGDLSITGTTSAALSAGAAVDMYGETLTNAGSGNFTLSGYSNRTTGLYMSGNTATFNNTGTGAIALSGVSETANGATLTSGVALNASGAVTINTRSAASNSTAISFAAAGAHVITSSSGNLTINAGDTGTKGTGFSATGNLSLVNNGSGAITLNGSSSGANGIDVSGGATLTTSGTGAVNLTGAGGSGNLDIAVATTGAITLGKGNLSGSNGQGISLVAGAGAISLSNDSVVSNNGALTVSAATTDGSTALTLAGVTVNVGSGSGALTGTAATGKAVLISGVNSASATGAGSVSINGSSGDTSAAALSFAASASLSSSGTVNITGKATTTATANVYAVNLANGSTLTDLSGDLSVTGIAGSGRGINLNSTLTNAGAGALNLSATSTSNIALLISGTNNFSSTGAGSLTLQGTNSGAALAVSDSGTLNLSANSAAYGTSKVTLQGVSSSGGGMTLGGAVNTSGTVNITARSATARALDLPAVTWTNQSGALTIAATSTSLQALRASNNVVNNSGDFSMTGTGGSNYGLYFSSGASFNNLGSGTFGLNGSSRGSDGVILGAGGTYNFAGNINLSGSLVSASAGQQGIRIDAGTTLNNAGQLLLNGSSMYVNGAALRFAGSSTLNNSGSMVLSGTSLAAGGTGIHIPAGYVVSTSGGVTLTDASSSAAGNAVLIDGTLSTSGGTLNIAPTSNGDITVSGGAAIGSTGAGDLTLAASGSGVLNNGGLIYQGSNGSGAITLSTVNGNLNNTGSVSGSATAAALTLRSSGTGAIEDSAGGITRTAAAQWPCWPPAAAPCAPAASATRMPAPTP